MKRIFSYGKRLSAMEACVAAKYSVGETGSWTLTKQAQNKLAAAQTKMEISMLNITYNDIKTSIWVRQRTKVILYNQQCEKNEVVLHGSVVLGLKTTGGPRVSPF